jgi:hypothetical protein
MCDERERLLDYLYDACDPVERRTVERHLEGCDACRDEVSGLRAVRLNLLAWDVPEHGSVWKPFAPARVSPWYREVPAWALAAAASLVFMLGLAGGVVSRQIFPAQAAVTHAGAPAAVLAPYLSPQVTSAELAAAEQRIMKAIDLRMDQRLQPVAAHGRLQQVGLSRQEVLNLTGALEEQQRQALRANNVRLLQDSQRMYVTNSQFNEWIRTVRYEIQQLAAQQQQGH